MTRFEWFEKGYGQQALNLGIISTAMFSKFVQYKMYIEHRTEGMGHIEAIEQTALDAKASVTTIWKAVYFFVKSNQTDIS